MMPDLIYGKSTLVQVKSWWCLTAKHYLDQYRLIFFSLVHSFIVSLNCILEWQTTHSTDLTVMLSDCVITDNPRVYNFITDWED